MAKTGRTILVFLVLVIVILVSGVSISFFMLQKETQTRQAMERTVDDLTMRNTKIETALKEARKEIGIFEAKNKEANDHINSLLEELDLEKGLNDKIKADNKRVRDDLEAEIQSKNEQRQKLMGEIETIQSKLKEAETKSRSADDLVVSLQKKVAELETGNKDLEEKIKRFSDEAAARRVANEIVPPPEPAMKDKVNLDRIVITPEAAKEGRVLNIDVETEFLIFDLGAKHGIKEGQIMSVYRGKTYLGDTRVSRVQDEMSAADFIPPFSSRKVRKNDQVVPKR